MYHLTIKISFEFEYLTVWISIWKPQKLRPGNRLKTFCDEPKIVMIQYCRVPLSVCARFWAQCAPVRTLCAAVCVTYSVSGKPWPHPRGEQNLNSWNRVLGCWWVIPASGVRVHFLLICADFCISLPARFRWCWKALYKLFMHTR